MTPKASREFEAEALRLIGVANRQPPGTSCEDLRVIYAEAQVYACLSIARELREWRQTLETMDGEAS